MQKITTKKSVWILLIIISLSLRGAFPAAAAEEAAHGGASRAEREKAAKHIQKVLKSTEELESRWKETKERYKDEMAKQVNILEAALDERQSALDYGDRELREQITEHIEDLSRTKADLEGELTELTAATGVNLSQTKGDIERTIDDWKD